MRILKISKLTDESARMEMKWRKIAEAYGGTNSGEWQSGKLGANIHQHGEVGCMAHGVPRWRHTGLFKMVVDRGERRKEKKERRRWLH